MLLINLKNYVQENKIVSLEQISQHFHMPASVVEGMLTTWTNKGVLKKGTLGDEGFDHLVYCTQSKDCPSCHLAQKNKYAAIFYSYQNKQ